jgi:hypothetical protein
MKRWQASHYRSEERWRVGGIVIASLDPFESYRVGARAQARHYLRWEHRCGCACKGEIIVHTSRIVVVRKSLSEFDSFESRGVGGGVFDENGLRLANRLWNLPMTIITVLEMHSSLLTQLTRGGVFATK